MAYVVKRIKNRAYVYHQTSKRVGKKVKTTSTYVGPLGSIVNAATLPIRLGAKLAMNPVLRESLSKPIAQTMQERGGRFAANVSVEASRAQKNAAAWETANAREGMSQSEKSAVVNDGAAQVSQPSAQEGASEPGQ